MIRGEVDRENLPKHKEQLWDFKDYKDHKDDKYIYGSRSIFDKKEKATLYTSLSAAKGMVTAFKKRKYIIAFIKNIEIVEVEVKEVKIVTYEAL